MPPRKGRPAPFHSPNRVLTTERSEERLAIAEESTEVDHGSAPIFKCCVFGPTLLPNVSTTLTPTSIMRSHSGSKTEPDESSRIIPSMSTVFVVSRYAARHFPAPPPCCCSDFLTNLTRPLPQPCTSPFSGYSNSSLPSRSSLATQYVHRDTAGHLPPLSLGKTDRVVVQRDALVAVERPHWSTWPVVVSQTSTVRSPHASSILDPSSSLAQANLVMHRVWTAIE